jgi:hypothetical protein
MNKKTAVHWIIFLIALAVIFIGTSQPSEAGREEGPVIYVTSQDLYYDSIVLTDLPARGPFQLLEMEGPMTGVQTEFGPGDKDYSGGRWWVDVNDNGEKDDEDNYFICPLLEPGRDEP